MSRLISLPLSLLRLLQRDGLLFFAKCIRHAASPKAWRWVLGGVDGADPTFPRTIRDNARAVVRSPWFDAAWILREYPEAAASRFSPAEWYLRQANPVLVHPGPDFSDDEYLALNFDAFLDGTQPLLHFERFCGSEFRPLMFVEEELAFPPEARPVRLSFERSPRRSGRTALFAAYSGDGTVAERTLYYLRGLREVADNVVFVSNSPLLPGEEAKLRGLAAEILCDYHGEYDFGSWKRAWRIAREAGLLDARVADEAVLANDSCYGPVFPFAEAFAEMAGRTCDFWGLSANIPGAESKIGGGREHIQSFFLVFRRRLLDTDAVDRFLGGVTRLGDRLRVIDRYETRLTATLAEEGFSWDTFLPRDYRLEAGGDPSLRKPLSAMRDHRMPLLKAKALGPDADEPAAATMSFVRSVNPELGRLVSPMVFRTVPSAERHARIAALSKAHPDALDGNAARIRSRIAGGERPEALFLVSSADGFAAAGVFEAMRGRRDPPFAPRICVVPDFREGDVPGRMALCLERLRARYPDADIRAAKQDGDGFWTDAIGAAAMVFYPTAAHAFPYLYAPRWSVGRAFLPVLVFDAALAGPGPLETELARQNYAYFWRIVFADRAAFNAYAVHSIRKGTNAVFSSCPSEMPVSSIL